ncbi:acyltransferase family protein [Burkholderia thailandensis]|uniref:acyltransferase family protein n=1 Tax=Burkholderia thailandensis TaxID=57975 RepID=UPI002165FF7E|nr:acyltransferase [Burkholderia thailandensis]MCS3396419.1 acyltransferase [Burkholderia thailandensis]
MQTQTASSSHSKNLDVEVLRAIAILGTMASHLDILFFWGSSRIDAFQRTFFFWGGVDLFFCISGYVITGNLLRTLPSGRQCGFGAFAIPFWIRRAWRILPSAWLWLAIPLILSVVANRTGYLGTPTGNMIDSLSAVAQVANFHFWSCYAFPAKTCGIDQVYWSLSLEEQCYILLPVLLYSASRRTIMPILCVVVLIQVFLPRPILSFLWFVRTNALALGALLALLQHREWYAKVEPRTLARGLLSAIALAGMCLILAALPGRLASIPFHTGLIALVSCIMVWIASYGKSYTMPDGAVKRVLVYFGSRSYAIYLIHVPVYRLTREIWERVATTPSAIDGSFTLRFAFTAIPIVLLLAELNYRFVETPLRLHGTRVAERWSRSRNVESRGSVTSAQ